MKESIPKLFASFLLIFMVLVVPISYSQGDYETSELLTLDIQKPIIVYPEPYIMEIGTVTITPTNTPTPVPTNTPIPTETPIPTNTPTPTRAIKEAVEYISYELPRTNGFKSYMSYKAITSVGSSQYKLQQKAYTGDYGIRMVDDRYCIAVGTYFGTTIGTRIDLILENGTVIKCILGDSKADRDTEENNIVTRGNGCVSEFIVDYTTLNATAKRMGDMSYCRADWQSPVKTMLVYKY